MKELMERMNNEDNHISHYWANQLQAYIDGLWTEITDDDVAIPSDGILLHSGRGIVDYRGGEASLLGSQLRMNGYTHFRTIIPGIDTPKEQS